MELKIIQINDKINQLINLILPFFEYRDLLTTAQVNKSFNSKVKLDNRNPIKSFSSESFTSSKSLVIEYLKQNLVKRQLETLFLQFIDIKDDDLDLLNQQSKLISLSLNACHSLSTNKINSISLVSLKKLELYWMPQLKSLDFLFKAHSLIEINLSGVVSLSERSYEVMIECTSTALKTLNLTRNQSVNNKIMKLIAAKFINLEYLNLYALTKLDTSFLSCLGEELRFLDLCGNQFLVDSHIESLKGSKLTYLNLVNF